MTGRLGGWRQGRVRAERMLSDIKGWVEWCGNRARNCGVGGGRELEKGGGD
jgi:hypothetical protein